MGVWVGWGLLRTIGGSVFVFGRGSGCVLQKREKRRLEGVRDRRQGGNDDVVVVLYILDIG